MFSVEPHHSHIDGRSSGKHRWLRAAALPTAFVLAISGILFSHVVAETPSVAATTGGMPVTHQGVDPNWREVPGWKVGWPQPLDEDSLYWVVFRNGSLTGTSPVLWAAYGWSADMSTYQTRPAMTIEKTLPNDSGGTDLTGPVFSTSAMARIGGTMTDPAAPLTVYFWDYAVQTTLGDLVCGSGSTPIVRATSGQDALQWSCLPTPYGGRYSAGGEADQYTGNIYMIPGGGAIDDQPVSSTAASTESDWVFMVWDPITGRYSESHSVQPGDWRLGMETVPQERVKVWTDVNGTTSHTPGAAYDISLDSDGNAYAYSGVDPSAGDDGNMSIVRMEPARDENGNIVDGTDENPWRYYVVTKIRRESATQSWSAPSSIYGNGIVNGQLVLGANTRVVIASGGAALPSTATAGNRGTTTTVKIDPLSATAKVIWSVGNQGLISADAYDNASSQGAQIIRGALYQDVNGDGRITGDEPGLADETVALYDSSGKLLSTQKTDSEGQYSFLIAAVSGTDTVFYVRPVEVTTLLPDGKTRVNGTQTWGEGSVQTGMSVNKVPLVNTSEIQCMSGNITSVSGPCSGARPTTIADPPVGALGSTSSPDAWLAYAKVTFNTGQYVPVADFGFTARGSFGDAPAGPLTADVPMHANVPSTVWLGSQLGAYDGPASDTAAHPTDDGVYLDSYAGKLGLEGTILANGWPYQLGADVSGPGAGQARVVGWTTQPGTDQWNTDPAWSPVVDGGKATGPFHVVAPLGESSVQLRVDASEKAITLPTNVHNEYYGTGEWTTSGEIEDYGFTLADTVYRPAARTSKGAASFMVAGQQITAGAAVSVGEAVGLFDGGTRELTATAPDNTWTVAGIDIKDTTSGEILARPDFVPGPSVTFSYTPQPGSDVVIEASFKPSIDLSRSTVALDKEEAEAGEDITATATVLDHLGDPVSGATVTFDNASDPATRLTGQDGSKTCVTGDAGTCSVTITSTVPGRYLDEVTAKVDGAEISDSPKTVTFTHGEPAELSFAVTPSVDPSDVSQTDWREANGTDLYMGVLTVRDQYGNPVTDLVLSDIQFGRTSTDVTMSVIVNNGDGTYAVYFASDLASSAPTATAAYKGTQIGGAEPIPFKAAQGGEIRTETIISVEAGPSDQSVGDPVTITVTVTGGGGDPVSGLGESDFQVTGRSDGLPDLVLTGFEETAPGVYTWSTTSFEPGEFEVSANVAGVGASEPATVTFHPRQVDLMRSTWAAAPEGPLEAGTGLASTYTVTATILDTTGAPIEGVQVSFTAGPGPVFTAGTSSCQTGPDGTCVVSLSSTRAGAYPVTAVTETGAITNATTGEPAVSLAWRAGEACVEAAGCVPDESVPAEHRTRAEVTRDRQTADGTAEDVVTVHVYDRWGNPVPGAPVGDPSSSTGTAATDDDGVATIVYTSTTAGPHPTDLSVGGASMGADVTLTFLPGPVCQAGCVPRGAGTDPNRQTRVEIVTNDALVGEDDVVAVYAFDQYGNAVAGQVVTVSTNDPDLSFGGSGQTSITVVLDSQGAATWTATSSTSGTHHAHVRIGGVEVPGSPLGLRFVGAPTITSPPTVPVDPVPTSPAVLADPTGPTVATGGAAHGSCSLFGLAAGLAIATAGLWVGAKGGRRTIA